MAWLVKVDKNGTKYFADNKCRKCNGTGYINGYEHIDGARCWDCHTTGISKPYHWKEYTPEYAQKLADRRRAKAIKEAPEANKRFFKKIGFDENGRAWVVVGKTYDIKDELKEAGAKFDIFIGWHFDHADNRFVCFEISIEDIGEKTDLEVWQYRSPCEIEIFISAKQAEYAPKSPSEYVGNIGEKFSGVLTLKNITKYKTHFTYYGETNYIYIFADENENAVIWKTSSFQKINIGDKYTVKGTIKEHSEYNGEKQTTLTRCKIGE